MIVGIIPAKGSSARVPHKNIKLFNRKPLVQWSIEHALASGLPRVILMTDDPNIKALGEKFDLEIWNEPEELAKMSTYTLAAKVCQDECCPNDDVLIFQVTSPIRESGLITRVLELKKTHDVVKTGFEANYVVQPDGFRRWDHIGNIPPITQNVKPHIVIDGALMIYGPGILANREYTDPRVKTGYVTRNRVYSIDIDTEEDWKLAENLQVALGLCKNTGEDWYWCG